MKPGKTANLAAGALAVKRDESLVIKCAAASPAIKEGQDWFPLTVDYREKAAAVGKFPGGDFKTERRPFGKGKLPSPMTARPLRPLFPPGYFFCTPSISFFFCADRGEEP